MTDAEQQPLLRALSPTPQDRYPTCRDFMTDILHAHRLKAVRNDHDQWIMIKNASRSSSTVGVTALARTPPPNGSHAQPPGGSKPHSKL